MHSGEDERSCQQPLSRRSLRKNPGQRRDTGVALQYKNFEPVSLEGFSETSFSARELAEFLGIASLGFNWRNALTVLFAVLALIICLPLLLIALFRHNKTKRYSFLVWMLLCLLGIAAMETEAAYWFFADQAWARLVWKAVVAVCLLSLFLIVHGKEGNLMKSFFPSVLLADVVISVHFISGVALSAGAWRYTRRCCCSWRSAAENSPSGSASARSCF